MSKTVRWKMQTEVLEDDAHGPPELVDPVVRHLQDVHPVDDDLASGGQDLPEDDLEEGRLARAAGSGNEMEIPAPDLEVDVRQGPLGGLVLLRDVKQLDH